jgi:hypothetical protein
MAALVKESGGLEFAAAEAEHRYEDALRILAEVPMPQATYHELADLALFILRRNAWGSGGRPQLGHC